MIIKSNFFKYLIPGKDIFMDDNIHTEYKTKNHIINLTRTEKKYISPYTDYKYICNISVSSILNINLVNIRCTEIDIFKLLDIFFYSIANNTETFYFFNNTDIYGEYYGLKLRSRNNIDSVYIYDGSLYYIDILRYNKISSTMSLVLSLEFINIEDISNFLDLLYYTFLVHDINIEDYKSLEDNLLSDDMQNIFQEFD